MKKWNKKPFPACNRTDCVNCSESHHSPFKYICLALTDNDFKTAAGEPYPCPFYKPKNGGIENGS